MTWIQCSCMPKLLYESSPGSSSCQRCTSALSKRDRQAAAILVHAAVLLGAVCSKLIQQVLQDLDSPYLHSQDAARTLRCLILKLAPLPLHGTSPFPCAESEAAWISPFPHYGLAHATGSAFFAWLLGCTCWDSSGAFSS